MEEDSDEIGKLKPLGKYGHLACRVAREFVHPTLLSMAMMHLQYPRRKDFLHWDELGCLSRALGYPGDLFVKHFPQHLRDGHPEGLQLKELKDAINYMKYLHLPLDRSYNNHTDDWNIAALNKAIKLMDCRFLSFSELNAVRMAYQLYEAVDTKGMVLGQKQLLKALKMCGRMISPKKMMQRLRHMRSNFEEKNRMQLHEFLDLLLWCEEYAEYESKEPELNSEKDDRKIFKLDDFASMLHHHDQKLTSALNKQYYKDEWTFSKEKHSSKKIPKEPPVDPGVRQDMAKFHNKNYKELRGDVRCSQSKVSIAKAGYVRERPLSAPVVSHMSHSLSSIKPSIESRPKTVHEFVQVRRPKSRTVSRQVRPNEGFLTELNRAYIQCQVPRPVIERYDRPQTAPVVTSLDLQNKHIDKESLKFEMEAIEMKYKQLMYEDMDFLMPGYKEKMANRPRPETPPTPEPERVWIDPRPSDETLNRLTYQKKGRTPPTHSKTCDARHRGWHKVKSKIGNHYVVSSPYYAESPVGKMYDKLHKADLQQLEAVHSDYIFRHTSPDQVKRDGPSPARPKTVPDVMKKIQFSSRKSSGSSSENEDFIRNRDSLQEENEIKQVDDKEQVNIQGQGHHTIGSSRLKAVENYPNDMFTSKDLAKSDNLPSFTVYSSGRLGYGALSSNLPQKHVQRCKKRLANRARSVSAEKLACRLVTAK